LRDNRTTMMKNSAFYVEISLKGKFFDAFGADVKNSISEIGISGVKGVSVSEVYLLQGDISKTGVEKIAKELFLDIITQNLRVYAKPSGKKNMAVAEIWYKEGVTDPVSFTALKGIKDLGFAKNISVKCGKRYEIEGRLTRQQVETVCKKILANTLIQEYRIL